ncbi:MazG-like family protein [Streptomyces sp. NPDC037389]|uniref:MazG-like family protein n=1 Tax=Streptomyces sp. NPDC037389 TaxID=3155369 RepID=UPI0033E16F06
MNDHTWDLIHRLADRLDDHSTLPPEQRRILQILKISEEAGEAAEAVIGALGQNPRKGFSHTWDDVQAEVCDVITTGMIALRRLTPDPAEVGFSPRSTWSSPTPAWSPRPKGSCPTWKDQGRPLACTT